MTIAQLGINITSDSARLAATNLEALVPAAQRTEKAVDKMSSSIATDLRGIEASADRMSAGVGQNLRVVESSVQGAGKSFAALGSGNIQNVAFQLQDFAVQVGAGTSASTALAQQLPQLLGGFGALGAVLGAVVAIGIPVASALLGTGEAAKSATDAANDLAGSADRLIAANDAVMQSNADLVASYGRNAEAMREVMRVQAETAQLDFAQQMRTVVSSLADTFGDLQATLSPAEAEAGWDAFTKVLYTARDALNTSEAEATKVVAALRALESADGVENQARASAELARAMAEAAGGADNLTGAAAELFRALNDVAGAGYAAAGSIDAAGAATDRAAAAAQRGIAAYTQFQAVMASAAAAQAKFDAQAAERSKDAYAQYQQSRRLGEEADAKAKSAALGATEDSRTGMGRGVVVTGQDRVAINRASASRAKAAGGGGGGGGGKSDAEREAEQTARALEKEKQARDRVIDGLRFEMEMVGQSEVARRIANETRKAGVDIMSEDGQRIADYVEGIHTAEEAAQRLADVQEYMAQTGADLFTSAISGADDFKDALANVAGELGQMLANQAFLQLVGGGKSGAPGMAGGIFGAILGGLGGLGKGPATGAFAGGFAPAVYSNGTNYHPGGPAIVNDRGGELINLPRGSQVIPHDISREMARGGQQQVQIGVSVDNEGGLRAYVKKQTTKSEGRAVNRSIGAVRQGDASSRHFWKR